MDSSMGKIDEFSDRCPYCGETILVLIDTSAGSQHYFEDCPVCCRPIQVLVSVDMEGLWTAQFKHESDV